MKKKKYVDSAGLILKAAFFHEEYAPTVFDRVRPEWFKTVADRVLWDHVYMSFNMGIQDVKSIKDMLSSGDHEESIGRLDSISHIKVGGIGDIDYAVEQMRSDWVERRIKSGALDSIRSMDDGNIHKAEEQIRDICADIDIQVQKSGVESIEMSGYYEKRLVDYEESRNSMIVPLPFSTLQSHTGGARFGEVWIWMGVAKSGKSTTAMNFAHHAIVSGFNAVVVSVEMSPPVVMNTIESIHAKKANFSPRGIDRKALRMGNLDDADMDAYKRTVRDLSSNGAMGKLHVCMPPAGANVDWVISRVRAIERQWPVHVVILDYLERMSAVQQRENYRHELKDGMVKLKGLAEHHANRGCWVLNLHQASRTGWERAVKNGHYDTGALSESSYIEREADLVGWTLRPNAKDEPNLAKLGVAAYRHGPPLIKGFDTFADDRTGCFIDQYGKQINEPGYSNEGYAITP